MESTDRHPPVGEVFRLIDANANRAMEGLRIVEDIARFVHDDEGLTRDYKELRHRLRNLLDALGGLPDRCAFRDTPQDVGTTIEIPSEYRRVSVDDLAATNSQRAQQSLRALEEACKLARPELAPDLERLRYDAYSLEARLLLRGRGERIRRLQACTLCLLMEGMESIDLFRASARAMFSAGVPMIQLRDKRLNDRQLLERAQALSALGHAHQALVIVNDRVDIAVASGADGVHLGQEDLPLPRARRLLGADRLIGISCHSVGQAGDAIAAGADYLGSGPTFPSRTKQFPELKGVPLLVEILKSTTLPVFAIGGISSDNLNGVLDAGGTRVAVSAGIHATPDPPAAARELLRRLHVPRLSSPGLHHAR